MTLQYIDVYAIALANIEAQSLLEYSDNEFYEIMKEYLHSVAGMPFVRAKFKKLNLIDDTITIDFELTTPVDDESDIYFVTNVFADGIVVKWLEKKKNTELTINYAIYGKEEKAFSQSSHLREVHSLYNEAFINFKKMIRDYGYINNSYLRGES